MKENIHVQKKHIIFHLLDHTMQITLQLWGTYMYMYMYLYPHFSSASLDHTPHRQHATTHSPIKVSKSNTCISAWSKYKVVYIFILLLPNENETHIPSHILIHTHVPYTAQTSGKTTVPTCTRRHPTSCPPAFKSLHAGTCTVWETHAHVHVRVRSMDVQSIIYGWLNVWLLSWS